MLNKFRNYNLFESIFDVNTIKTNVPEIEVKIVMLELVAFRFKESSKKV